MFLKDKIGYKVLLVKHIGGHWGFPKGQNEAGETPLQTAKREVFEETGISKVAIVNGLYFDHYFSFVGRDNDLVHKKIGFFVGEVYDDKVILQKEELSNFVWKDFDAAKECLTFDSDKDILEKVYKNLGFINE